MRWSVLSTCELVIAELPGVRIDVEEDPETGYNELIFENAGQGSERRG